MKPWHLGNTTVRSPFRLRDGLVALSTSSLQGNLRGQDQEIAFRNLLGNNGIVKLGTDETYSVGRKWRSALEKLGFLYPEIPTDYNIPQNSVGIIDMITPNGWRLIRAETVQAIQECFLRSLSAHFVTTSVDIDFNFSPLRHTLSVMLDLEKKTGESCLNFIEIAVIVQLSNNENAISDIVNQILELRSKRLVAVNKRKFDNELRDAASEKHGYVPGTFNDYADTNIRYLKATGLVQSKGRGLSFVPEKHFFIEKLIEATDFPESAQAYYKTLCNGATLPTDNKDSALAVLDDLLTQLNVMGINFQVSDKSTESPADIAIIRHQIEELIANRKEEEYSTRQAKEWEEITAYMELLVNRKNRKLLSNGEEIEIPQSEAPAYFEWVLWRAFLAINSLVNKPYESRRFKIDQDFLPVGTAPGNGPDLIFEFNEFVIVVEVTLTENSRQEAAEGEPVRRHIADLIQKYRIINKKVIGLFIANRIDSNTAETFRIGIWYDRDDNKMELEIIPLTLLQFKNFFENGFKSSYISIHLLLSFLIECASLKNSYAAPDWKRKIEEACESRILYMKKNIKL